MQSLRPCSEVVRARELRWDLAGGGRFISHPLKGLVQSQQMKLRTRLTRGFTKQQQVKESEITSFVLQDRRRHEISNVTATLKERPLKSHRVRTMYSFAP